MDVLGDAPFTLDLADATLTVYRRDRFKPPNNVSAFAARSWGGTPLVRAFVDGAAGWFQFDTGTEGLLLSGSFTALYESFLLRVRISELGTWDDDSGQRRVAVKSLEYLGHTVTDAYPVLQPAALRHLNPSMGLLGPGAVRDARVTIDMAARKVWVEWPRDESLKHLLGRLGKPNSRDLAMMTPLLHAAFRLRSDAVEALLKRGDDPNLADDAGITPLMVAAGRGDAKSAAALLAHGASHKTGSGANGQAPLVFAAQYGKAETAKLLLDAGADVNLATTNGRTPLFAAAEGDQPALVELLLAHGADVEKALPTGETPLVAACRNGSAECVAALLRHNAKTNVTGRRGTPLTYAARAGSAECARLLLEAGAAVDGAGPAGATPLQIAAGVKGGANASESSFAQAPTPRRRTKTGTPR